VIEAIDACQQLGVMIAVVLRVEESNFV